MEKQGVTYNTPVNQWIEGLPLGNGNIAAMVWGTPQRWRFSLNKADIWDNRLLGLHHPYLKHSFVTQAIKEQNWKLLEELENVSMRSYGKSYPSFQPAGELEIVKLTDGQIKNFQQHLSFKHARIITKYIAGECTQKIDAFIHAEKALLIIKAEGTFSNQASIQISRTKNPTYNLPQFGMEKGKFWMEFELPDGLRYVICSCLEGVNYGIRQLSDRIQAKLGQGKEVVIYLTILTSNQAGYSLQEAKQILDSARAKGYDQLLREHLIWWHRFWSKSSLHLEDSRILKHWYFELYKLASCSKDDHQMPGLQGLWSIDNEPPWHGDYHTDLNIQMTYWPIFTSNHLELGQPFYKFFYRILPQVKKETFEYYGWEGVKYPCATYPKGKEIGGWFTVVSWPGSSAWIAQHYWWHYLYSQDTDFLRKVAYPVMRECVKFYQQYLKKDEAGKYQIFPTISPEQGDNTPEAWGKNSAIDVAFVKYLYKATIKASRILGLNGQERKNWISTLKHFPDYPTEDGILIELKNKSFKRAHRHLSVLSAIYPVGEIGLHSQDYLRKLGERSYRALVNLGTNDYCSFTYTWVGCIAARLGLEREVERWLNLYLDNSVGKNGFSTLKVPQDSKWGSAIEIHSQWRGTVLVIEAGGGFSAAVNEALLQSYEGKVKVFPCVPKSWGDVKISNFRAEGAFLVTSELRSRKVNYILIQSLKGRVCHLINPWRGKVVRLRDLTSNKVLFEKEDQKFSFKTEKDHFYLVENSEIPLYLFDRTIKI